MKLMSKNDLHVEDGYILTEKDEVVLVDQEIIRLYNELDLEFQKGMYLNAQPKATPMLTLDEFTPVSEFPQSIEVEVSTPMLDEKVRDSIQMMEELEKVQRGKEVEKDLDRYHPLISWADRDKVIIHDDCHLLHRVDAPFLKEYGGILKITPANIFEVISKIHGASFVNDDDGTTDGE